MSVQELQTGHRAGVGKHAYSLRSIVRPPSGVRPATMAGATGKPTWVTASTRTNLSRFYNCDWIIGRGAGCAIPGARPEPARPPARMRTHDRPSLHRAGGAVTPAMCAPGRWNRFPAATLARLERRAERGRCDSTMIAWRRFPSMSRPILWAMSVETYTAKRA